MKITTRGFTLIEFLTVTVVVASIGLVTVGILTSALRGAKKTTLVNTVRVNGNQAINQMTRLIEYARSFEGVSTTGDSSHPYTTNCAPDSVGALTPTPTPKNIQYKYLKITSFDGEQIVFSCSDNKIALNGASLIDTNTVIVDSPKCWFTCSQDRITSNPIIGISFQLIQRASKKGILVENQASIPFETSVAFRNLVK